MSKETIMTTRVLPAEQTDPPSTRPLALFAIVAAAACLALGALAPSAAAAATFAVTSFSTSITNQDGTPDTQAGSHPYQITTSITFSQQPSGATTANVKDISVALPPGLIGNPNATPECTIPDLDNGTCPNAAQVGQLTITNNGGNGSGNTVDNYPIYNLVPPAGEPAQFGAIINGVVNTYLDFSVRTGSDYGITSTSANIPTALSLVATDVTLWGVPADPSHDDRRCASPDLGTGLCSAPNQSGAPDTPLLTMPTSCGGPLTATLSADSWQTVGDFVTASSTMPAITGCDRLQFNPSITLQPDTSAADSPSGLSVDLSMPQDGLSDPTGLAEADLQDATVTLPAGVSVNPSAANGLSACTPDEIGIDDADAPTCPDASKVGTVEVDSPLLADPLEGGIYVAQQDDNPFGSLLAIYVTAYADGVWVKLAGHVAADPVTGQLTTTFSNNPQLPFTDFKLDFFGGPEGVLATPESCGTFSTSSSLTPWSGGAAVVSSDPFAINSACVSGFAPSFTAGTQNPQAGAFSPFVLSFSRQDTDQNLSGLTVKLPPGMLAKLAGVQECSDAALAAAAASSGTAEQANPSCPAGSQVGTVTTGAGTGPDPFFLGGKAYLTGPYKGAPYGLAVVVPALAGPYDLGTVVVRQALYVDPTTAQVTAVSDPFPTILQGIPLDIRQVDVNLNRPAFTVNPTSCDPMAVTGTLTSTGGMSAPTSARFQVGGCASLAFSPRLKIGLTGKGRTRSGDHPTLTATLTQPFGQANIHTARVALPLSLALDPNNSQVVCPYATAASVTTGPADCPADTKVGTATAYTPLLSQPLTGPVYLVQGLRCRSGQPTVQGTCPGGETAIRTLPSLLIPLRGQIALDLRAQSSVNGAQQLVTTFATIPDAPVSKFVLTINGGRKGILVITGRGRTICGKAQVANANFGAQSGKTDGESPRLATPACRGYHKTRRHKRRRKHVARRAAEAIVTDRRLS